MNTLPLVKSYIKKQGVFCTDKPYSISCLDDFIVGDLTSFLTKAGLGGNYFFELVDEKDIPAEGYRLEISSTDIKAVANDRQGLLYALQTMKQLVFLKKSNVVQSWIIPTKPTVALCWIAEGIFIRFRKSKNLPTCAFCTS